MRASAVAKTFLKGLSYLAIVATLAVGAMPARADVDAGLGELIQASCDAWVYEAVTYTIGAIQAGVPPEDLKEQARGVLGEPTRKAVFRLIDIAANPDLAGEGTIGDELMQACTEEMVSLLGEKQI